MLLDRIDIDAHGPLHRIELGPFSEHLNVVRAPRGSGKTAICRFLRDTLVDRHYPIGMLSSSTGRVVWADRDGMLHCYREQDGTRQGRRRVHFEPRGEQPQHQPIENDWLGTIDHETIGRHRDADPPQVPEAIADGVITDTSLTSVARVVSACIRTGIDSAKAYDPLPLIDEESDPQLEANRRRWRSELAEVDAELARSGDQHATYESLIRRRQELIWSTHSGPRPNRERRQRSKTTAVDTGYHSWRTRLNQLYDRARELRSRQSQLRRWIEDAEQAAGPDFSFSSPAGPRAAHRARNEWQRRKAELQRVTVELDDCLNEAAQLRQSSWSTTHINSDEDRTIASEELRRIDDQLASLSRIQWLRGRRDRLRSALQGPVPVHRSRHPLATAASNWLIRLTAGRLNRIDWSDREFAVHQSYHADHHRPSGVSIDGRDESRHSASDRAIAAIAVRLGAGELLSRLGHHLPLVLEIHHELALPDQLDAAQTAYQQSGTGMRRNHALATALRDYAAAGRQLLILTSDSILADGLERVDARRFNIFHQRTVHAHRPAWRSHHETETYVGPHYDPAQIDSFSVSNSMNQQRHAPVRPLTEEIDLGEINRDFDIAWQETAPLRSMPSQTSRPRGDMLSGTDAAIDGTLYRDGYHYSDQFTTHPAAKSQSQTTAYSQSSSQSGVTLAKPRSPYLLSVDSPIDQAPSIDAVAAARLRRLNVTHVTHLMQQDANRLADSLGLADVDASTVRRWKSESRLCCQVPKLRNFDARILVGCGITRPSQLSATHPADLLEDVEAFLATEEGTRILASGTSHELARLTTWIATANRSTGRVAHRESQRAEASQDQQRQRSNDRPRRRRRKGIETREEFAAFPTPRSTSHESATTNPPQRRRRQTRETQDGERVRGDEVRRRVDDRPSVVAVRPQKGSSTNSNSETDVLSYSNEEDRLRFYLDRSSPVVDAPTIGSRMAERLAYVEIYTVDDLLQADPDELADQLNHRRTDAETIREWQQQATLVCRVPLLRGHDAQLLVAAGVTTAEDLATCEAESLFQQIDDLSQTGLGRRIIRGGQDPDREEVSAWIDYAQHTRELKAA